MFFTTETGHFGVNLAQPKAFDQVAVLLGCQSLMLLRPTKYGYSVVGACYVQGFMDAEALLGPLPEDWKRVPRVRDASEKCTRFFSRNSGEITSHGSETGPTARRLATQEP